DCGDPGGLCAMLIRPAHGEDQLAARATSELRLASDQIECRVDTPQPFRPRSIPARDRRTCSQTAARRDGGLVWKRKGPQLASWSARYMLPRAQRKRELAWRYS